MPILLKLAAVLWVSALPGLAQGEADGILAQLSELRLDKNQIHSVRDVTIRRDVISLSFERGAIAFVEPVEGRVTGAVFVGSGDVLLIPPDDTERRQINKFTGSPILNEEFNAAIIRFTDDSYQELLREIALHAADDVRADELEALLPWEQNLGEVSPSENVRVFRDLIGSGERPFFSATVRKGDGSWFNLLYDETYAEEVLVSSAGSAEAPTGVPDIWASFNRRSEARDPEVADAAYRSEIEVLSYEVDTTIDAAARVDGRAEVRFRSNFSGERVAGFMLSGSLRIAAVRLGQNPVPFFQEPFDSDSVEYEGLNEVTVVLPRPMTDGEVETLVFEYEGPVLARRGRGTYYVGEGRYWYPTSGSRDAADYDLTFHYPSDMTLVATGRLEDEAETPGVRHSRWEATNVPAAGFAIGGFRLVRDDSASVPIDLYLANDREALYQELRASWTAESEDGLQAVIEAASGARNSGDAPAEAALLSNDSLAGNILGEVRRTVDYLAQRFGPYPFGRISVVQFPVEFVRGWPSLVYVSTLSFLDAGQRARLGFEDAGTAIEAEWVRTSQIAHQWFGNAVSGRSYRDQWLIEGLAEYAAIMYLEEKYPDRRVGAEILDGLRSRLTTPIPGPPGAAPGTYDDNGPLWLGYRLARSSAPEGYIETLHTKAPWVFHMLRHLMGEPTDPAARDARFVAMVRDFVDQFVGGKASTWDFRTIAERHLTPRLDPSGDGALDGFLDAWVFETGLPSYALDYAVEESGGGFIVSGELTDTGAGIPMAVPIYARTEAGAETYLGDAVIAGGDAEVFLFSRERPVEVLVDPEGTILKRP